ncbi:hypothetical protein [Thaumasiovibrio subtropicus]|uniref:hypothetical protein n=1 Tax=Thaumasiovibrio subtropicus TaxID=1891207 RepID=UPI000B34B88D|nr:hypothetical protein [Thaumasiovibrio subtropicus]
MYAALLVLVSVFVSILGVFSLGVGEADIPLLVLVIPAVWLLPQGRVAAWLMLAALGLYGSTLNIQPLAVSVSVWMLLPVLFVVFSKKSNWQLGLLMMVIVFAMYGGLMALQRDGKLGGEPMQTAWQVLSVMGVWFAARSWRPISGNPWFPAAVALLLWVAGSAHAALVGLCVVGLIAALQGISQQKHTDWIERLAWILPSVSFAALVVTPRFVVPNSVLVCWLLVLCSAWLGEYLLEEPEEDF